MKKGMRIFIFISLTLLFSFSAKAEEKMIQGLLSVQESDVFLAQARMPKTLYEKSVKSICKNGDPCKVVVIGQMKSDEHEDYFQVKEIRNAARFDFQQAKFKLSNVFISESSEPSTLTGFLEGKEKSTDLVIRDVAPFEGCVDGFQKGCPLRQDQTYPVKIVETKMVDTKTNQIDYEYFDLINIQY